MAVEISAFVGGDAVNRAEEQADIATDKAVIATTKAGEAVDSAAAALASLSDFKGRWYGPLAAAPALDPNGAAIDEGDAYWDTASKSLQIYNGTVWVASGSGGSGGSFPTLVTLGGVGDGVTSDQTAVTSALATPPDILVADRNKKFLVTSLINHLGVEIEGSGHIVKAIAGGQQKLNSYGDMHKYVCGQEYMVAFHNLLLAQAASPTRKPIMVFSGDSTTAGVGASAGYLINVLVKAAGEAVGLQMPYGLASVNRGVSSANTEQWRLTHLAADLAANPDLLVLRWGINDPGYYASNPNTGPALDAGQSAPGRRTASDFITSLRGGLAAIRASRGLSSLSIILMTPNSTSDTPNGRDELWYEQITPGIKQAARDYQCTFVDTYAYLRDSRPAAGVWMDNPFGDGRGIHPLDVMNIWIAGLLSPVIFPEGLRYAAGRANFRNYGGVEDAGDVSRLPETYPYGMTLSRAFFQTGMTGSTAWPLNGSVLTIRSQDNTVMQILYPYHDADRTQVQCRLGRAAVLGGQSATWGDWFAFNGGGSVTAESIALALGYTPASAASIEDPLFVGAKLVMNGKAAAGSMIIKQVNVASVVKNSTGVYTITFTTPLADANYLVSATSGSSGGGDGAVRAAARTTTTCQVVVLAQGGGATFDPDYLAVRIEQI